MPPIKKITYLRTVQLKIGILLKVNKCQLRSSNEANEGHNWGQAICTVMFFVIIYNVIKMIKNINELTIWQ